MPGSHLGKGIQEQIKSLLFDEPAHPDHHLARIKAVVQSRGGRYGDWIRDRVALDLDSLLDPLERSLGHADQRIGARIDDATQRLPSPPDTVESRMDALGNNDGNVKFACRKQREDVRDVKEA